MGEPTTPYRHILRGGLKKSQHFTYQSPVITRPPSPLFPTHTHNLTHIRKPQTHAHTHTPHTHIYTHTRPPHTHHTTYHTYIHIHVPHTHHTHIHTEHTYTHSTQTHTPTNSHNTVTYIHVTHIAHTYHTYTIPYTYTYHTHTHAYTTHTHTIHIPHTHIYHTHTPHTYIHSHTHTTHTYPPTPTYTVVSLEVPWRAVMRFSYPPSQGGISDELGGNQKAHPLHLVVTKYFPILGFKWRLMGNLDPSHLAELRQNPPSPHWDSVTGRQLKQKV